MALLPAAGFLFLSFKVCRQCLPSADDDGPVASLPTASCCFLLLPAACCFLRLSEGDARDTAAGQQTYALARLKAIARIGLGNRP